MTSLMSNMGSFAVLCPLAANTAVAAGWDPRGIVMTVSVMTVCAIALPSASSATAMAHAAAGYKLSDSLKFSIPFCLLALAGCVASALIFYPIV